jgi:hypothetical protein
MMLTRPIYPLPPAWKCWSRGWVWPEPGYEKNAEVGSRSDDFMHAVLEPEAD